MRGHTKSNRGYTGRVLPNAIKKLTKRGGGGERARTLNGPWAMSFELSREIGRTTSYKKKKERIEGERNLK